MFQGLEQFNNNFYFCVKKVHFQPKQMGILFKQKKKVTLESIDFNTKLNLWYVILFTHTQFVLLNFIFSL